MHASDQYRARPLFDRWRRLGELISEHLHFFKRQYHFSERHLRPAPQLFPPGTFPCCEAPVYAIVLELIVWHRCPCVLATVRYPLDPAADQLLPSCGSTLAARRNGSTACHAAELQTHAHILRQRQTAP